MDSAIQTGKGFHWLEVSKFGNCPLDLGVEMFEDPRYIPITED